MSKRFSKPHDKLFKRMISDLRVAEDFFKQHLPRHIQDKIDFSTLSLENENFIDERFRHSAVDLVYHARFKNNNGHAYFLVEHQTHPLRVMPFRLVKYMGGILDRHIALYGENDFPLIYPIIFYTGKRKYSYSTGFFDLFGDEKESTLKIWSNGFQLVDINAIDDESLLEHPIAGAFEYAMKYDGAKNFLEISGKFAKLLKLLALSTTMDFSICVVDYVLRNLEDQHAKVFIAILQEHLLPEQQEKIMTFAQLMIKEGYEKGMEAGMEQLERTAINLLNEGFSIAKVSELTQLTEQQLERLSCELPSNDTLYE
jgi:predicted transposase/invertase (TIGR01784 family)